MWQFWWWRGGDLDPKFNWLMLFAAFCMVVTCRSRFSLSLFLLFRLSLYPSCYSQVICIASISALISPRLHPRSSLQLCCNCSLGFSVSSSVHALIVSVWHTFTYGKSRSIALHPSAGTTHLWAILSSCRFTPLLAVRREDVCESLSCVACSCMYYVCPS
jgi:hypothetical protein